MKDSVEENYKRITVIILQQDAAIYVIPPFMICHSAIQAAIRPPFKFVVQSGN
jgi:hypothetical protein